MNLQSTKEAKERKTQSSRCNVSPVQFAIQLQVACRVATLLFYPTLLYAVLLEKSKRYGFARESWKTGSSSVFDERVTSGPGLGEAPRAPPSDVESCHAPLSQGCLTETDVWWGGGKGGMALFRLGWLG